MCREPVHLGGDLVGIAALIQQTPGLNTPLPEPHQAFVLTLLHADERIEHRIWRGTIRVAPAKPRASR